MNGDMERPEANIKPDKAFKKRLKSWWNGDESPRPDVAFAKKMTKIGGSVENDGPPTVNGWSLSRQQSVVTLFGEGMTRCIPDDVKSRMTQPLGINKTLSVSELGSGLGGFARWVASEYNAYVTGYDEDPTLQDAAIEMTTMAGLNRKVNFFHGDFENFAPKERSANIVYAAEALFCVKNKRDCFTTIRRMLKPPGQFMMSDYMLDGVAADDPVLADWQKAEPLTPHLLDVQETRKLLTDIGFEVSIAENVTDTYKANVLRAFSDYAKRTGNGEKSGHLHGWILKEGELWTRRIQMMDEGHLKVFRIYARSRVEIF